jgi:phenylacetate-CoA ligase
MRALGGRGFALARRIARGNRRQLIYDRIVAAPMASEHMVLALRHARASVPFYQSPAYECLDDGSLRDAPVLTKDIIRTHFEQLKPIGLSEGSYRLNSSGGSTGAPITLCQDLIFKDWSIAAEEYFFRRFLAINFVCVPKVILWGSERDVFGQTEGAVARLSNWLTQTTFINSFRMSNVDLRAAVDKINRAEPALIKGYAGSLDMLARHVHRVGSKIFSPKCIYSSAEVLSDSMRSTIQDVFRAQVHDFYGSREVGPIAGECASGRLHLFGFHNHVEIVDENGTEVAEGQQGRVLVTTLHNQVMPLIRYEIGDLATKGGRCRCGDPLPTLGKVVGRTTDHFLAPDGSKIHGEFFTHLFYFRSWVSEFQVVQETVDRIRILYVSCGTAPPADVNEIANKMRLVMGASCKIEWEQVESIPRTPQGKFTFTRSNLAC